MDMHGAYAWMMVTGAKPEQKGRPYEGSLRLGEALHASLSRAVKGVVEFWDSIGQAVTRPLKSYTYCATYPAECAG
jgi:hypothetical protein